MKSASVGNLAPDLQRWLKSVKRLADIIDVSTKLVPKVHPPNLMTQEKDNSWSEQ
ncbi:MAG: hypothetical protein WBR26_02710 [Candidatus Acidiferrum sp.]